MINMEIDKYKGYTNLRIQELSKEELVKIREDLNNDIITIENDLIGKQITKQNSIDELSENIKTLEWKIQSLKTLLKGRISDLTIPDIRSKLKKLHNMSLVPSFSFTGIICKCICS